MTQSNIPARERIQAAIEQLVVENIKPSARALRHRLGEGSFATLQQAVNVWRESQVSRPAAPELPGALAERALSLARTLWVEASAQAQTEVAALREQHASSLTQLQADLAECQLEVQDLEGRVVGLEGELAAKRDQCVAAEAAAAAASDRVERVRQLEVQLERSEGRAEAALAEASRMAQDVAAQRARADALQVQFNAVLQTLRDRIYAVPLRDREPGVSAVETNGSSGTTTREPDSKPIASGKRSQARTSR
jgi:chromosome segregation ATPase